ncbi:helix-turn-helix domain-containing protein [Maribacter dokdonensis]|uniref:helix-turn-helix domain-containing protein n=1 Tax=Maribacter dokdonensis TaxID=320912 RepID=UPI001B325035|nr:helix-turn-helix transcriptional regulator [Maribacter dokdonensis]
MIAIEVNSLPIGEVMSDISKAFNTTFSVSCGEYFLSVPPEIGEGNIKGVNFDGGMGILQYDCLFNQDVEFQFTVKEVHPVKFLYCLEGQLRHRFEGSEEVHEIDQYQEAIVSSDFHSGHILKFQAHMKTVINSLEITRNLFQNKIKCELITMNIDLQNLFLEGKAFQMLTEQILQYEDDSFDSSKRSILRRTEIKQVEMAVHLIKKQISELNNISDIAGDVGLSPNKLQEGFQNLYGTTVNKYIQKIRLDLIKDFVLNTEYSMAEIAHMSGLSSKSYLSKIFKEEYGKSPSDYRKNFVELLQTRKLK